MVRLNFTLWGGGGGRGVWLQSLHTCCKVQLLILGGGSDCSHCTDQVQLLILGRGYNCSHCTGPSSTFDPGWGGLTAVTADQVQLLIQGGVWLQSPQTKFNFWSWGGVWLQSLCRPSDHESFRVEHGLATSWPLEWCYCSLQCVHNDRYGSVEAYLKSLHWCIPSTVGLYKFKKTPNFPCIFWPLPINSHKAPI